MLKLNDQFKTHYLSGLYFYTIRNTLLTCGSMNLDDTFNIFTGTLSFPFAFFVHKHSQEFTSVIFISQTHKRVLECYLYFTRRYAHKHSHRQHNNHTHLMCRGKRHKVSTAVKSREGKAVKYNGSSKWT